VPRCVYSEGGSDACSGVGDFDDRDGFDSGARSGQTYNPDYPVCMQVYDIDGGYIACRYTSLAQCAQSASGLAAQCIANPYFAGARVPAGPHYRRHRRVY
jgi:hypothetical protein